MIAIVLAAGYATRLYPLTENFPKPLLPVNEKPILNWLLDDLEEQEEITGYVIVSNHKFIGFNYCSSLQLHQLTGTLYSFNSVANLHRF